MLSILTIFTLIVVGFSIASVLLRLLGAFIAMIIMAMLVVGGMCIIPLITFRPDLWTVLGVLALVLLFNKIKRRKRLVC